MKVQVENVSPIEKRLQIEVEPSFVEKELSQAYAQLSRRVRLPGFRPGKVPRRILEQKFKNEVEADVIKRVQIRAYVDAVKEHNVPAVGDPQLSGGAIEAQKPFAFTARVEVKPEITPKDYKGLVLKKFTTDVADEKVEEQLARLRESRTTVEKIEGRDVAQKGDLALIDFDATKDGQPFPGNTGRDVTVEVADGQLIEGNLPQLEGMKVGDRKEFDYTFPADYRVDEVKGQTAKFTVTLKELRGKKVPAADDAFARELGLESLDALKSRIRQDLERAAKRSAAVDERADIFQKLIEKNDFEVPNALVERGIESMLDGAFGQMRRQGFDFRNLNLDWNRLREELKPRSLTEVRGRLLLEAIAAAEKLDTTDADLEAELEFISQETGAPLPAVKAQFKSAQGKDTLRSRALERKAIEFVKSHAKFE
ncbi:MAG: trigger factor [Myxococcota bacterium]